MASICAACSRNLLSRPTIPSSSRLPTSLPRLRPPRQFSTLLAPCFKRRVPRSDAKSYRLATTSAFNSSRSGLPDLPPVPSRPNIKVSAPSLAAIREEGFYDDDVKLLPPEEAFLNITPEAIQQLTRITSREPIEVLSQDERGVDDYVLQPEGVACIPVVIDLTSFGLLKGATLHHATELIGSSFRLQDNPQAKEGGACGCGVSWEAK
ncbi:hypothetical protein D1P53_002601 [Cryptococcus gattii VGV]|nr:hypothetical protein D1P53_002601 [Cryptococcus gattii VGV]